MCSKARTANTSLPRRTGGAPLCHVHGKQDVAGANTNTGPPSLHLPPTAEKSALHGGWRILLLNELISLPAEADKDHSFLTFALEGMIFITNLFCFCCYGLHSGNEQRGNFPQSHGSVTAPKMNSWYYRLSFTHKTLIGISSFLTTLDKINIPKVPIYRVRAESPVSPTRWGNKHLILLLHKKSKNFCLLCFSVLKFLYEKTINTSLFSEPTISFSRHSRRIFL